MAYQAYCDTAKRSGLWFRDGKRTFRLTGDTRNGLFHLTLRGGTLAGILDIGDGDVVVTQFMHEGKRCIKRIGSSFAVGDDPWAPSDVWIANGRLTWVQGSWQTHPYGTFAVLSSKLAPGCDTPGPNARFDFTPETSTVRSMALDGQQLFYAGQDSIRRHTLPAEPSFAPPANDDFENAQPLPGDAPTFASGWTAYATTQPGEPLANSKQTVWYAFRPTTSRPLYVNMGYFFRGEFAIYTGSSLATLTPVPTTQDYVSKRFDAVAGETYWIAVGTSDPDPFYYPFTVAVAPDPLSG
jgi:hypothetical protein